MLESLYDILNIIYIILLISLVLYIIILLVNPDYINYYFGGIGSDNKNKDNIDNILSESEESIDTEYVKKYNYKKYPQNNFEIKSLDNITEESNENNLTFDNFCELIDNSNFIKEYKSALLFTFDYKKDIYTKKLKEVNNDLLSYNDNNANVIGAHNTNVEKLKIYKNEIENILKIIQQRKNNLTDDEIKKNFKLMIYNKTKGFNSLVGREEVKNIVFNQIYSFCKNPKYFFNNFQNFIFYGNSGVGKTKLAETLAYIYCKSGILIRQKYRCITTQELKSPYINESGKLTREILLSTLEGFLLIDEAYEWVPEKTFGFNTKADHGEESLTEMINFLDKNIGNSMIGLSGYHDKMQRLIESNQGLDRRFPNQIILHDYNSKQLTEILIRFIENTDEYIKFNNYDSNILYTLIDYVYKKKKEVFDKQAGSMLNLSSYILKAIYTTKNYIWNDNSDSDSNNLKVLTKGLNEYLKMYGININY